MLLYKKNIRLVFLILMAFMRMAQAQEISGKLTQHPLQSATLYGYQNFETIELGKTKLDINGAFSISCSTPYQGMGYIETEDKNRS